MTLRNVPLFAVGLMIFAGCSAELGQDATTDPSSTSASGESVASSAESLTADQINGFYAGDDGGFYYVRTNAARDQIFWYGEHPGNAFGNIATGPASEIATLDHFWTPHFMDIPKGLATSAGDLAIQLRPGGMTKFSGSTFGGNLWTKLAVRPERAPINIRGLSSGSGATGVWIGDDRGVYFVHQADGKLGWFGQVCSAGDGVPISGNVFQGPLVGGRASGMWADVPYGLNNNLLGLSLNVGASTITAVAGVPGRTWSRVSSFETDSLTSVSLKIRTGGDDLRAGSVAYGYIELASGVVVGPVNLNGGANWPNNSVHTVSFPLPAGTQVRDIAAFKLLHDGAPRNPLDSYDNWNADSVQVSYDRAGVSCPLQIGSTLTPGRMTGSRPTFRGSLLF